MSFNTIYSDFNCPHCQESIESGIGFRFGHLNKTAYKLGDALKWQGKICRPSSKPNNQVVKTLGHFNCDNLKCSTWSDCFPDIQTVLITIENNRIAAIESYTCSGDEKEFAIIEPQELASL